MLQAVVKRARELSTRAKSYSVARTAGPEVGDNSARDKCMSDVLKTNFLSSPSACAKMVDHVH